MADATPFAVPATIRRIGFATFAAAALTAQAAPTGERFGAFTVAREEPAGAGVMPTVRPTAIRLNWRSHDGRFDVSLIDNGVALRSELRGLDAAGKTRCTSNGPLLVYDSADWMDLRWRTLIEEQGNFLRTCHVIDQKAARKYRGQFLGDAREFPVALSAFKSAARETFGPGRARCLDFRDGSDVAIAGRERCEMMVER